MPKAAASSMPKSKLETNSEKQHKSGPRRREISKTKAVQNPALEWPVERTVETRETTPAAQE